MALPKPFFPEDRGAVLQHPGGGTLELVELRRLGVADPCKQIGNMVVDRHRGLLPARLYHSGELTPERQLPETDPAEPGLAVKGSRPPASRASVVFPEVKLR